MLDSNTRITNARFENGSALSYAEGRRLRRAVETDSCWYTIGSWWMPLLTDGGQEEVVDFEIEIIPADTGVEMDF